MSPAARELSVPVRPLMSMATATAVVIVGSDASKRVNAKNAKNVDDNADKVGLVLVGPLEFSMERYFIPRLMFPLVRLVAG